jgi:hypothetical protein
VFFSGFKEPIATIEMEKDFESTLCCKSLNEIMNRVVSLDSRANQNNRNFKGL